MYFGKLHTDLLPTWGTALCDREREKFQRWSVNALSFLKGEHDRLWTDEGEILARTVSKCDFHDYNQVAVSGTP